MHVFHLPPSGGVLFFQSRRDELTKRTRAANHALPPRKLAAPRRGASAAGRWPHSALPVSWWPGVTGWAGACGRHLRCALTGAGIDPAVWSAADITGALEADMRARGWCWPDRIERRGLSGQPPAAAGMAPRRAAETRRRCRRRPGRNAAAAGAHRRAAAADRDGEKRRSARCWRAGQGPGLGRRAWYGARGIPARSWAAVNQPRASDVTVGGSVGAGFGLGGGGVFWRRGRGERNRSMAAVASVRSWASSCSMPGGGVAHAGRA